MPSTTIQWFPGHMAKTKRLIRENLSSVDIIIELLDARIPQSSKNPDIVRLIDPKPSITLLNKASLADPDKTAKWSNALTKDGRNVLATDCTTGQGLNKIESEIKGILSEKISRNNEKGMMGRTLKAMVLGIPNVGKSSLINKLCGFKKAQVEDRPGVTLKKQWVKTNIGIELLDMPGVLWPKFDDLIVGENLALTGAIKDDVLITQEIALVLCKRLKNICPELLCLRYKLTSSEIEGLQPYELFEIIGKKRGFLVSGGEVDFERCGVMLLDEFRGGKIGRITLDRI